MMAVRDFDRARSHDSSARRSIEPTRNAVHPRRAPPCPVGQSGAPRRTHLSTALLQVKTGSSRCGPAGRALPGSGPPQRYDALIFTMLSVPRTQSRYALAHRLRPRRDRPRARLLVRAVACPCRPVGYPMDGLGVPHGVRWPPHRSRRDRTEHRALPRQQCHGDRVVLDTSIGMQVHQALLEVEMVALEVDRPDPANKADDLLASFRRPTGWESLIRTGRCHRSPAPIPSIEASRHLRHGQHGSAVERGSGGSARSTPTPRRR